MKRIDVYDIENGMPHLWHPIFCFLGEKVFRQNVQAAYIVKML